jgi:hypothetical protein
VACPQPPGDLCLAGGQWPDLASCGTAAMVQMRDQQVGWPHKLCWWSPVNQLLSSMKKETHPGLFHGCLVPCNFPVTQ